MAKVTSKLQVTIPKVVADQYGIEPGDHLDFQAAGPVIRVVPEGKEGTKGRREAARLSREERLRLFDAATARQREREKRFEPLLKGLEERGWTREDLYDRGTSR